MEKKIEKKKVEIPVVPYGLDIAYWGDAPKQVEVRNFFTTSSYCFHLVERAYGAAPCGTFSFMLWFGLCFVDQWIMWLNFTSLLV